MEIRYYLQESINILWINTYGEVVSLVKVTFLVKRNFVVDLCKKVVSCSTKKAIKAHIGVVPEESAARGK